MLSLEPSRVFAAEAESENTEPVDAAVNYESASSSELDATIDNKSTFSSSDVLNDESEVSPEETDEKVADGESEPDINGDVPSLDEPTLTASSVTAAAGYALLTVDGEIWRCDSQGNPARSVWTVGQAEEVTKLFVAADAKSVPENALLKYGTSPSFYSVHILLDGLRSVEFLTDTNGRSAVASIGKGSFWGLPLDEVINLDRTVVRSIGDYAFNGCTRLTSIDLPETLIEIGNYAFEDCSVLSSVSLPATIRSLGNEVFYGCSSLDEIWVNSTSLPTLGSWAFRGTPLEKGYSTSGSTPYLHASARVLWQIATSGVDEQWTALKAGRKVIDGTQVALGNVSASWRSSMAWTGTSRTQSPVLCLDGKTLSRGIDYTVSYRNNVKVGTATMVLQGRGLFTGQRLVSFSIVKAAQPMKVKAVKRTVKSATLQKKTVAVARPIKFTTKPAGKVTYKKVSGAKGLTVNTSTGKVSVKRGTKKGTYKIRVKVTAAGNANYKAGARAITCVVVVK